MKWKEGKHQPIGKRNMFMLLQLTKKTRPIHHIPKGIFRLPLTKKLGE
jgi:hypothetical protein